MTTLLLALLLVAPIQPVSYSWEIAPEPPPPAVAPPWWQPWRLDAIHVTLHATEAAAPTLRMSYQIPGHPEHGWVAWTAPLYAPFGADQTRTLSFSVPWSGYAPGPFLLSVWQTCPSGVVHHQGGFIPRPGQTLPAGAQPFSQLAAGEFCPAYTPPNAIFSDGFETGTLRRWALPKGFDG